jgi:hypothetical protein
MEIKILGTGGFSNDGSFFITVLRSTGISSRKPRGHLQSLRASSISA